MQRSKQWIVSRVAIVAAFASMCQGAIAADVPMSRETQAIVDFQCHQAKTLKQAEANYANMGRGYTDAHPVMECLKKKIEELKAGGK
jgi:hypothetical protein